MIKYFWYGVLTAYIVPIVSFAFLLAIWAVINFGIINNKHLHYCFGKNQLTEKEYLLTYENAKEKKNRCYRYGRWVIVISPDNWGIAKIKK